MNKKIVTLIIVILISFCFISLVVAHNNTHDGNNSTDPDRKIDNKTDDKNITPDRNESGNGSGNYIIAQGSGSDIRFSDGFRGFMLDYSKPPASTGDEFRRVSTSKASNSNTLKLAIVESYKLGLSGQIGPIMADFIKTGSSSTPVGQAVASSHERVGDHAVIKINKNTEAVFNFEVLESVSGNKSNYFAYSVSFRTIDNQNKTNVTNVTNITNATNVTNITGLFDNETNETFLAELYALLLYLADLLFDAWEPIIETLINDLLMFINLLEDLAKMYEEIIAEIQELMDALQKFLDMLDAFWKELDGLLKLVDILMHAIQQLLDLIDYIIGLIQELIAAIIALIQQLLDLLYSLINFLIDLINQIIALIQAILDFLKSVGSFMINVFENAVIIIGAFLLITIGAFVYNRIKSS